MTHQHAGTDLLQDPESWRYAATALRKWADTRWADEKGNTPVMGNEFSIVTVVCAALKEFWDA